MSSLHASAHSIIDGALANDDVRNVDGIVARLSTFVELSVIKSVPMVNDEVVGIMNALVLFESIHTVRLLAPMIWC